ncbi:MAG TPA: hypothetical protein VH913_21130, partial [Hyphomicrobiaceae bacterium]
MVSGRAGEPRPDRRAAAPTILAPVLLEKQPLEEREYDFPAGRVIDSALDEARCSERLDRAVNDLLRQRPADSAGGAMVWPWQRAAATLAAVLIAGGIALAPDTAIVALTGMTVLPFVCVALLRLCALYEVALASRGPARREVPAPP